MSQPKSTISMEELRAKADRTFARLINTPRVEVVRDGRIKTAEARCSKCGQRIYIAVAPAWRMTKLVRCPSCKTKTLFLMEDIRACLYSLAEYEEAGIKAADLLETHKEMIMQTEPEEGER